MYTTLGKECFMVEEYYLGIIIIINIIVQLIIYFYFNIDNTNRRYDNIPDKYYTNFKLILEHMHFKVITKACDP